MKENIGIINYWWAPTNYGALLTGYALQQLLISLNYNALLIDNKSMNIKNIKEYENSFNYEFSSKNIKATLPCLNRLDFENLNNEMNIFITGSDQVFSPTWMGSHFDNYYLNFVSSNSKKIAFSASFGVDKETFLNLFNDSILENIKYALTSYDVISVREESGVEICRDLFGVNAEWIIDPVFIINKSNYDELIKNSTIDFSNKIVSYVLDTNKEYEKAYKYLSKQYNTEVVDLAYSNVSVENWLAAIKNCQLFVTDSFHGMCFAIIFNKPFICVTNKKRGITRFTSILKMLGINNQCINSINEIYECDCIFNIDYRIVNKKIGDEAQRGIAFLKKAVESSVGKKEEKLVAKIKFLENELCKLEEQATLKYQVRNTLWNLWLIIFHKLLPTPIKNVIRFLRCKNVKK